MNLTGKKVVIIGLGKSGVAAADFALRKGAAVSACDSQDLPMSQALESLVALGGEVLLGGNPSQAALNLADVIVLSPGVPHVSPALMEAERAGAEIIGELEFAGRYIHTPMIAITGTNGKTTTTELCSAMLKAAGYRVFTGGNIGTPLIEYAGGLQDAHVCVVEVSSFQLDTIKTFRPHIAAVLNVTPDHLDRYDGNIETYGLSKMRIFRNQMEGDYAILNVNDAFLRQHGANLKARTLWFGALHKHLELTQRQGAEMTTGDSMCLALDRGEFVLGLRNYKLLGPHNRENLAAAALAALAFGADAHKVEAALADFAVSPHRVALVGTKNGVRFVDDSKATNIGAVARALDCFDDRCVLIMGGLDKGCEFSGLRNKIAEKALAVVAIGAAKDKIAEAFNDLTAVVMADDMPDAVNKAYMLAQPAGCVLLSPACASFDMFDSYAHRGDEFIKAVEEL